MKNKDKKIEAARESLNEILKQIEPYIPKPPQVKQKPARLWQVVDSHVLPPLNSSGRS
jgi:hypothetical protein